MLPDLERAERIGEFWWCSVGRRPPSARSNGVNGYNSGVLSTHGPHRRGSCSLGSGRGRAENWNLPFPARFRPLV